MRGYNDYYRVTEGYLRNFNSFHIALNNMRLLKENKVSELSATRAPIARYGIEPGGSSELTVTESMADRNMTLKREVHWLDMEIIAVQGLIERVDSAIAALERNERRLVELRYLSNWQWKEIESASGYSERHCKRKATAAVWKVCGNLFPHRLVKNRSYQFIG